MQDPRSNEIPSVFMDVEGLFILIKRERVSDDRGSGG